jgi:hypothetical protein
MLLVVTRLGAMDRGRVVAVAAVAVVLQRVAAGRTTVVVAGRTTVGGARAAMLGRLDPVVRLPRECRLRDRPLTMISMMNLTTTLSTRTTPTKPWTSSRMI